MKKQKIHNIKPLKKAKMSKHSMSGCSRTAENICGIAYRQST